MELMECSRQERLNIKDHHFVPQVKPSPQSGKEKERQLITTASLHPAIVPKKLRYCSIRDLFVPEIDILSPQSGFSYFTISMLRHSNFSHLAAQQHTRNTFQIANSQCESNSEFYHA